MSHAHLFLTAGMFVPFGLFLIATPALQAQTWNPDFLLRDQDLEDTTTLSADDIQNFLEQRRGTLSRYHTVDIDGVPKPASHIITRVSQTYRLNPQFLLVLMQREQGIVEDPTPGDAQFAWATGYAICDRCEKDHPELVPYRGFENQLEQTAKRFRETFLTELDSRGATFTGWGPGITKFADGIPVTPKNRATAALYTYTPHVASNRLLWKIWQTWFSHRYPDGSLLRASGADAKTVWLIEQDLRRPITTPAALYSRFDPSLIIPVAPEELLKYDEGRPIQFADYSLLRSPRGTVYLLVGNERRGIPSREVFRSLGFKDDEVTDASFEDLASYHEGASLTSASAYPQGALLQHPVSGGIYFVENGVRYPLFSREILRNRFGGQAVIRATVAELETYPELAPIRFRDGTLVGLAGQSDIFFISGGERRPVPSAEIFEAMGWQWSQVVWTHEKSLSIHPFGKPISLENPVESSEITVGSENPTL